MANISEQVGVFRNHSTIEDEKLKEVFGDVGLITIVTLMPSYKNWRLEFGFDKKSQQTVNIYADTAVDAKNINIGHFGGIIAEEIYNRIFRTINKKLSKMKKKLFSYIDDNNAKEVFPYLKEKGVDTSEMEKILRKWEDHDAHLIATKQQYTTADYRKSVEEITAVNMKCLEYIEKFY